MRAQLRSEARVLHPSLLCMQEMRSCETFAKEVSMFAFLLGCIGWIPSFFFESFEISWLLKLLLSVITYLAMNFVLDSPFYKWLATRNATQLSTFISDSDCFD